LFALAGVVFFVLESATPKNYIKIKKKNYIKILGLLQILEKFSRLFSCFTSNILF